jgi:hypothetical protein
VAAFGGCSNEKDGKRRLGFLLRVDPEIELFKATDWPLQENAAVCHSHRSLRQNQEGKLREVFHRSQVRPLFVECES